MALAAHPDWPVAADAVRAELARGQARIAASGRAAVEALAQAGRLRRDVEPPALALPASLGEVLATAVCLEAEAAPARAETLRRHYLDLMPRLLLEQVATTDAPQARFFHTPLDWAALPRTRAGLEALFARCQAAGIAEVAGFASAAALVAASPTLWQLYRQTHYATSMPLLYAYPADLAWLDRAADEAGLFSTIDRYLSAPLVHELTHFGAGRDAIFPLYLDECIGGYLGIVAAPHFAYPAPGEDGAIFAASWFAQVGQAVVRLWGEGPLLRAQAGVQRWDETLPPALLAALVRIGWRDYLASHHLHFLADNQRAEPWLKLLYLAAAGRPLDGLDLAALDALPFAEVPPGEEAPEDLAMVRDGLRALCLDQALDRQHFVVTARAPEVPITVDLLACRLAAPPRALDPGERRYLFPPPVAARLRDAGLRGYTVEIRDLGALDELAARLVAGEAERRCDAYTFVARGSGVSS